MSILDNEGHDPNGLFNRPTMTEIEQLRADKKRLLDLLRRAALYVPGRYRGIGSGAGRSSVMDAIKKEIGDGEIRDGKESL